MSLPPSRSPVAGSWKAEAGEAAARTDTYVDMLLAGSAPAAAESETEAPTPAAPTTELETLPHFQAASSAIADRDAATHDLEPGVRSAAELLRRSFVRFHPSFRFEEELAARLRRAAWQPGARGEVVPLDAWTGGEEPPADTGDVAPASISSRRSFLSIWPSDRLDLGRALERTDLGRALERTDLGRAIERLDVGHAVERIDVGRALERLDVGHTVERIDLARTADRIQRHALVGGAIASGVSLAGVALMAWRRGHRTVSLPAPRQGER